MNVPTVNFDLRRHTFEEGKTYHEVSFCEAVEYWDDEDYYHPDNIDENKLLMCLKENSATSFLVMDLETGEIYELDPHDKLGPYHYFETNKV